ncbi:MAG: cysteine desulfurase, partial [Proteobacteria bacterium]|nr:cysteine desulfurase [Pseudomonadota bacterium]
MSFDPYAARAEFPILSRQVNGRPLAYLDSAASAQKPQAVIDAMVRTMTHSYANVHRGIHTLGNEATEAYEGARETVARFIKAAGPHEIVFTKGATEAINLVASSFGRDFRAGDEIVLTEMEHHANLVPWRMLAERTGAVIRYVPITEEGALDLAAYHALLNPRTRMVAVVHMSNVLGTVNPVSEMAAAAREVGAAVLLDGCQAAVHAEVDVQALGCDFYAFSGHKLYGPTGIGVLWGKAERLEAMPPYQGGGEMIESVSLERVTYGPPPGRFEAGTPQVIEAVGLKAAVDWLQAQDRPAIAAHERALYDHTLDRLRGANDIRIFGEAPDKGAILSFELQGAHAHDVAQILDRYGVAVRAGTHCAEPLMHRFGVTSTARASFALYN